MGCAYFKMLSTLKGTLLHGWLVSTLVQPLWRANRGNNTKLGMRRPSDQQSHFWEFTLQIHVHTCKMAMSTAAKPSTLCSHRTAPRVHLGWVGSITNSNSMK